VLFRQKQQVKFEWETSRRKEGLKSLITSVANRDGLIAIRKKLSNFSLMIRSGRTLSLFVFICLQTFYFSANTTPILQKDSRQEKMENEALSQHTWGLLNYETAPDKAIDSFYQALKLKPQSKIYLKTFLDYLNHFITSQTDIKSNVSVRDILNKKIISYLRPLTSKKGTILLRKRLANTYLELHNKRAAYKLIYRNYKEMGPDKLAMKLDMLNYYLQAEEFSKAHNFLLDLKKRNLFQKSVELHSTALEIYTSWLSKDSKLNKTKLQEVSNFQTYHAKSIVWNMPTYKPNDLEGFITLVRLLKHADSKNEKLKKKILLYLDLFEASSAANAKVDFNNLWLHLAHNYEDQKYYKEAILIREKQILPNMSKNIEDQYGQLGRLYRKIRQFEKAAWCYEKYFKTHPKDETVTKLLINVYLMLNKPDKSLFYAKKLEDSAWVCLHKAFAYKLLKKFKKAALNMHCALSFAQQNKDTKFLDSQFYYNYGVIMDLIKHKSDATILLVQSLKQDPENYNCANYLARLLAKNDNTLRQAKRIILNVVHKNKKNAEYWETLAFVYYRFGLYQKARETIKESLRLSENKTRVQALILAGDIALALNYDSKALHFYKQAYEMSKNDPSVELNARLRKFKN